MVLAQLQLVSLLVWLPLDQESVKVMQLPIQWKPFEDNLMQKPKYVAYCFSRARFWNRSVFRVSVQREEGLAVAKICNAS